VSTGPRSTFALALGVGLIASATAAAGCGSHAVGRSSPSDGTGTDASTRASPDAGSNPKEGAMVGALDAGVRTGLPPLPAMTNVVAVENDDSVSIKFEPVDGARDYRVYPLPQDSDISTTSDGHVVVKNATYRCAGDRESPAPEIDNGPSIASCGIRTEVDGVTVDGYARTLANAVIGYVYGAPAPGLVPVYALGDANPRADDTCYFARWGESRVKKYITSDAERSQLLAARWRDDGIAFYAPAVADGTTRSVYTDVSATCGMFCSRYYFSDAAEVSLHPNKTPAFLVRQAQDAGAKPLMRLFYQNICGWSHDELALGQARFDRAYKQGDQQPWYSLLWSGLTGPTTLVVEALDTGCPFQGQLAPHASPAVPTSLPSPNGMHQPLFAIDDVRSTAANGEVFINGQHEATSWPKAIARSFISVAPVPHAPMDWFATFSPGTTPETFTQVPCGVAGGNCFQAFREQSATFDATFIYVDTGTWQMGPVLGELWVNYADWASDSNGKFRLTPKQKAKMDATTFLHVTMEVDAVTTQRRYPQILISDQDAPVQYALPQGNTVIAQSFGLWPPLYQIEVCNHRTWDVNNQCPAYDLYHLLGDAGTVVNLSPSVEVGEHEGVDYRTLFDVYASTQRTYLFLDGQPYACANMPTVGVPSGPVTVTFGDVLYHSAIDQTFAYHKAHLQYETRRHFDNLGFSSGVPAPAWDESRLPCASPITP
jgi:hypothetical protein